MQYAVFGNDKGTFEVFFKAPREANMQKAFEAFTVTKLKKAQRRESVLGKLAKFKEMVKKPIADRQKRKELEL